MLCWKPLLSLCIRELNRSLETSKSSSSVSKLETANSHLSGIVSRDFLASDVGLEDVLSSAA